MIIRAREIRSGDHIVFHGSPPTTVTVELVEIADAFVNVIHSGGEILIYNVDAAVEIIRDPIDPRHPSHG